MAQLESSAKLFDDFLVIGLLPSAPNKSAFAPKLLYHFNPSATADGNSVVEFCFPEAESSSASESFTFTLTQDMGTRVFGFCRRLVQSGTVANPTVCLCVLSQRPWFSLFMHMLDILQLNYDLNRFVPAFMAAAHGAPLPPPGGSLVVGGSGAPSQLSAYGTFRLHVPEEERPTGVSFEPLLASLGVPGLLRVLAALMREQRVIFVSSRWGHVSSCAHAAQTLLYPLQWQHIFIPVLPKSKFSYAAAPMPFVVGVLARHLPRLQREAIAPEVIFVDLDRRNPNP